MVEFLPRPNVSPGGRDSNPSAEWWLEFVGQRAVALHSCHAEEMRKRDNGLDLPVYVTAAPGKVTVSDVTHWVYLQVPTTYLR